MFKPMVYVLPLLCLPGLASGDAAGCLYHAMTREEMAQCGDVGFQAADAELNRVYREIRRQYADEPAFLARLKAAQLAWIRLRDADLEMIYPAADKQDEYGSAYGMCASSHLTGKTLERIVFLKQWLAGVEEGDVCAGSIHVR